MFKTKKQIQQPSQFEMTFFPALPKNEDVKTLKKMAFDVWMIYVALGQRHHEFGAKALEKEALFEHQYKRVHFGSLPDRHEYIPELKRLAKEHIVYQAGVHGTVSLDELLGIAELRDTSLSTTVSPSLSVHAS